MPKASPRQRAKKLKLGCFSEGFRGYKHKPYRAGLRCGVGGISFLVSDILTISVVMEILPIITTGVDHDHKSSVSLR